MKIKTEVIKTILVVTCVNSRLDAAVAQAFFKTVQGYINKGHIHLALDLGMSRSTINDGHFFKLSDVCTT